jgi:hypothetical protein
MFGFLTCLTLQNCFQASYHSSVVKVRLTDNGLNSTRLSAACQGLLDANTDVDKSTSARQTDKRMLWSLTLWRLIQFSTICTVARSGCQISFLIICLSGYLSSDSRQFNLSLIINLRCTLEPLKKVILVKYNTFSLERIKTQHANRNDPTLAKAGKY